MEAAARAKARAKVIAYKAKARYLEGLKPQASATKEDLALAERVSKVEAAAALKMTPTESKRYTNIKERMEEIQTQKRADDKRKAERAVTASESKAAQPKPESRFDSESEDDTAAITRVGFDNFCDEHLGVAVHKAWHLKLVGRLEAAYERDEITSKYLK